MKSLSVRLKVRAILPGGSRQYLDPSYTSNGKLRAGFALVEGEAFRFDSYTYAIRYLKNGSRIWEHLGPDPAIALATKLRIEKKLAAVAAGVTVVEDAEPPAPKRDLRKAIAGYLSDTNVLKERRTYLAYSLTLRLFTNSCPKTHLEDLDRRDVLNFMAFLREQKNVPRTIYNRLVYLRTFLLSQKLKFPLEKTDWPKYTDKVVTCYAEGELRKLIKQADLDERDMIFAFLGAGLRDKELQFLGWPDIDYGAKTITVSEKLDLGFRPKDKEEGAIPVPDYILAMLRERRSRYPGTRLVFESKSGSSQGHFLRVVKRLALTAGLNCGHCVNKKGKSCATHPVCKRIILHKLRKTFATMHHESGVSARTIQRWLRHSDLNTTLRYLAASDDTSAKTRDQVNTTFSAFA